MANESPQDKEGKSSFLHSLVSPRSKSVGRQDDQMVSKGTKTFFGRSRSEASIPLPLSTAQYQTSPSTQPGPATIETLSPGHGDHGNPAAMSSSQLLVPAPQDLTKIAVQGGADVLVSHHQSPEPADAARNADSTLAPPKTSSKTKNTIKVTGRFIETLLKKLPDLTSGNPARIALGLAKMIVEIKQGVGDNMDAVERRMVSVAAQLETVVKALEGWRPGSEGSMSIKRFQIVLEVEFAKLQELSQEWIVRKIADHENEKSEIAAIFEKVNEARIQFQVETGLQVSKTVESIEERLNRLLLKELQPCNLADHKYYLEGEKKEVLRRVVCAPGTHEGLQRDIVTWAKDPSSATIYWLFGSAGSGKSTIAYTIARRFEFAANDAVVLGGNFFCSREIEETRSAGRIIPTIAYHLALRCEPFADALRRSGKFDTIHQDTRIQLKSLLIAPWKASESVRHAEQSVPQQYLIIIDALDEVDGDGGSDLLRNLLNVIDNHHLRDIKFFVTSQPDQDLVDHINFFTDKKLYRLHAVDTTKKEKKNKKKKKKKKKEKYFTVLNGRYQMKFSLVFGCILAQGFLICLVMTSKNFK
ncbi:hypothetical protein H0H93_007149 [Arthromyces matolae]|nr:hypothetical protein H0H93_007149 [Arthromyces matolae]